MALFRGRDSGFTNVIRCDEPDYLIWKWHPNGSIAGQSKRENAIRFGSSLRVKDGSVAVFVYTQPDGSVQDYIEGPYDAIIDTKNLPVISSIIGLAYAGGSPFQAEVYFINLANLIQVKFAVPYFDVFDPRFLDYGVPVAVRGSVNFKISDYREFIRLHRLDTFSVEQFKLQIRDSVIRYVKGVVTNAPADNGIPVLQIEKKINEINDLVEEKIKNRFSQEYGVTVSGVDIATIEIDKASQGFKELLKVSQELSTKTRQAEAEVNIKDLKANQKIGVFQRAAQAFVDVKEGAYERRKRTQSANIASYQIEASEKVGVAAAEGFGKMSANGGSNVGGMNPTSMMAGMAVGSVIGQNMAGAMHSSMSGFNQAYSQNNITPPPVPEIQYHVVLNGQAAGPFSITTLNQMALSGTITPETFVWKPGLTNWIKAVDTPELVSLFSNVMPPIPPIPEK